MLEPGTRIAGFRIDGYLASGGMGNSRSAEWLH
jgi:hypothetical protein